MLVISRIIPDFRARTLFSGCRDTIDLTGYTCHRTVIRYIVRLYVIDNALHFLIRNKGALNTGRLLVVLRIEQHVSLADQFLCTRHVEDRSGIHLARD